ncbi:LapA family protein [Rhodovibrio salinarum]|uniref:LapA family protein n=1 Tax=Rhodovibrio salinarum TaxID=1087 RepID=UPI0004BC2E14|nr:LapA family protein [Rhodovibrio salinarum]
MKYLSWIITLPLIAVAVIFSVNHRQPVEIDLWPLPLAIEPPLFLVVLLAVFIGFLIGGSIDWWSQGRNRRTARWRRYRIEELEREVGFLKRKLEKAQDEAGTSQAGSQPSNNPRLSAPANTSQQTHSLPKTGS